MDNKDNPMDAKVASTEESNHTIDTGINTDESDNQKFTSLSWLLKATFRGSILVGRLAAQDWIAAVSLWAFVNDVIDDVKTGSHKKKPKFTLSDKVNIADTIRDLFL